MNNSTVALGLSAKVATVALFMEHVQYRMQYEAAAVAHFGNRRHRQLRWRTFIKWQQAYSAICRAISAGSADTVVAYGEASFSSSSGKGNPSTPTVSLRRILGYHCRVFDTDNFRTSRALAEHTAHLSNSYADLNVVTMPALLGNIHQSLKQCICATAG